MLKISVLEAVLRVPDLIEVSMLYFQIVCSSHWFRDFIYRHAVDTKIAKHTNSNRQTRDCWSVVQTVNWHIRNVVVPQNNFTRSIDKYHTLRFHLTLGKSFLNTREEYKQENGKGFFSKSHNWSVESVQID